MRRLNLRKSVLDACVCCVGIVLYVYGLMFYDWRKCLMSILGNTKKIPSAVVLTFSNKVILCALTEGVLIYIYIVHMKRAVKCALA